MAKIDEIVEKIIEDKLDEKAKESASRIEGKIEKDFLTRLGVKMAAVKNIKLTLNGKEGKESKGLHHKSFEEILKYIAANISIILVGAAGSGKTQIAVQCADLLKKKHYSISVNEHTSKTDFLGYTDATGQIVKTNFRKAYEDGAVFIIDEIDCANPNILTIINSALSNGFCPFPDGMVSRHEDFLCICTANTFGEGESVHYIGRNALDAATRDRFATIFVDYDENIEKILNEEVIYNLGVELRKYFKSNNIEFIVSTRGMLRLTSLMAIEGYKLTATDIKNCFNLHTVSSTRIDEIISKAIAEHKVKTPELKTKSKTKEVKEDITTLQIGARVKYINFNAFGDNESNPLWGGMYGKIIGTITKGSKDNWFINWDNGQKNSSYSNIDLKLVTTIENIEESIPF